MVQAQPGAFVVAAAVGEVPIGVDAFFRMDFPQRVGPAVTQHDPVRVPALREKHRIINPALRHHGVDVFRNDVVVAAQNDRLSRVCEVRRVMTKPLEPPQLVIELRAGCRIAVGEIETTYDEAVDVRFEVTAVGVIRIAGQAAPPLDGHGTLRQDRNAVIGFLAVEDCAVPGLRNRFLRELFIRGLEFLETGDVRLLFFKPAQQHRKPAVDTVYVEGGELHGATAVKFLGRRAI